MTKFPGNSSGFTLVEMMVILAVLGVLFGMAIGIAPGLVNSTKADSALVSALNAVEVARNRSIGERREFQVLFTMPNIIEVKRVEVPSGSLTPISSIVLDNGQTYYKFTPMLDTPDGFGNASAIDFGTTPTIRFTSDGSLLDSSGDPVNGTVFFGNPARATSARAITIFGTTGLIKAWKWDGTKWVE